MLFPKSKLCNMHFSRCLNCFIRDALHSVDPSRHRLACVDGECSNMDCVSSVFRTATLRTHIYNICWWICTYIYIYMCMSFRKDVVTFKIAGKEKGGILIRSLFSWLICNNTCNVLLCDIVTVVAVKRQ
jgi:hypothetical protein